jgi:glycosyltransferase involved in cell wall biosynthesis
LERPNPLERPVSVLIPTFNGANTIERTLKSVLSQDINTEIVIVDDSSTDQTLDKAEAILKLGNRPYKVIRHENNKGLSASLNDGLNLARGDNVLVLHQDCELMRTDWISTATKYMEEKIAVVTGYYGISDSSEMNLAKKTFGLLRRQIHGRGGVKEYEIVNFSEGKCDLYNARLLRSIGGFPEKYRIAGEDLSVSIQVQQRGYKILKHYDLPVIQRYGGKAESFSGNLQKEFEFGKAMGGIIGEHKLTILRTDLGAQYGRSRTIHRVTQMIQTAALLSLLIGYLLTQSLSFAFATLILLVLRYLYYALLVSAGLRDQPNLSEHRHVDTIWMPSLGIVSDILYSAGVVYGLLKWASGKKI